MADDVLPIRLAVCGNAVLRRGGTWYTHHSFGRIIELLSRRVAHVHYHAPEMVRGGDDRDYALPADRVSVHPWFPRRNTLHALRRPLRILRDYAAMTARGDAVFLRGTHPLVWTCHWFARWRKQRTVHWVVGNPVALLRTEQRGYGRLVHQLGLLFAICEQHMLKLGMRVSRAHVLANGDEVAAVYRGPRTQSIVSTSISTEDFRRQDDTCTGPRIRLLFVGFIRPEKGLEYLVRALPLIQSDRPVDLAIVGPAEQFKAEKTRLERIIDELGLAERVSWEGYAAFGAPLFGQLDRSDILVLPSLSEGTPRVLVEARARSVPVVSTTVGGIPTSVTDGVDGLLVPPTDPPALAAALSRLINVGDERRAIITRGYERVKDLTVERFVELVLAGFRSDDYSAYAPVE